MCLSVEIYAGFSSVRNGNRNQLVDEKKTSQLVPAVCVKTFQFGPTVRRLSAVADRGLGIY
jgi:hypothetical protein